MSLIEGETWINMFSILPSNYWVSDIFFTSLHTRISVSRMNIFLCKEFNSFFIKLMYKYSIILEIWDSYVIQSAIRTYGNDLTIDMVFTDKFQGHAHVLTYKKSNMYFMTKKCKKGVFLTRIVNFIVCSMCTISSQH